MDQHERDQFRRIDVMDKIEKCELILTLYHVGIEFQRNQILRNTRLLGRIAERLGEPEEDAT
jgi:hypothetical protein